MVQKDRPIYVDLDGTLIKTDLLWETLAALARQKPWEFWRVPFWAIKGKARLKAELAKRIEFDPSLLPYREEVVAALSLARQDGRRVVLATGTNVRIAEAISAHLGVFDAVMASTDTVNLTAERKLERIREDCETDEFDYVGNSRDDVCLLDAAAEATVVAPDRHARGWQRKSGAHIIEDGANKTKAALKALRPHQWAKNILLFVPLTLNHDFLDLNMLVAGLMGFVAFSLAASSVYIVNDLLDLQSDRRHKTKRNRPFASGTLPIPAGLTLAGGLLVAAFAIASQLPPDFKTILLCYLVMTSAYSLFVKRMLLIDTLVLAGLYTVRIIGGAAAADVGLSFWLLAFSLFFFFSLALVKRYTELHDFGGGAERSKTGRGYVDLDLETISQAGMASGFASVMVLALYIDSSDVRHLYDQPWLIWPLCPLVLYIIVRIWILARRNQMHDDPVVFIMQDWRSQIMIGAGAIMFLAAAYA
ncbi:UbiA family prenyltransferase [Consotaella salsifontis]|uniref:UbiA family prenyltransferase n=1 Tax=Consotaella salsifontis TaxID=1365950 RepID=UPI00315B2F3A